MSSALAACARCRYFHRQLCIEASWYHRYYGMTPRAFHQYLHINLDNLIAIAGGGDGIALEVVAGAFIAIFIIVTGDDDRLITRAGFRHLT